MGRFVVGDVVVIRFPFSDLSATKRRPALVLATAGQGDLIICQITSKPYASKTAIAIDATDFANGSLPLRSYVRPDKLFTADQDIILRRAGHLRSDVLERIRAVVQNQF